MIRDAVAADAARICKIYNHYIESTVISFEEAAVDPAEIGRRIADVTARFPWLVHEEGGVVLGYAYAAPWHKRAAYGRSVESTIYLAREAMRRGIGTQLYRELIGRLREAGVHAVVGSIALPNPASVALHEKLGFVKIGALREIGFKHGRWVDVGYWQLLL